MKDNDDSTSWYWEFTISISLLITGQQWQSETPSTNLFFHKSGKNSTVITYARGAVKRGWQTHLSAFSFRVCAYFHLVFKRIMYIHNASSLSRKGSVRISVSTSASHALEPGSIPGRSNSLFPRRGCKCEIDFHTVFLVLLFGSLESLYTESKPLYTYQRRIKSSQLDFWLRFTCWGPSWNFFSHLFVVLCSCYKCSNEMSRRK